MTPSPFNSLDIFILPGMGGIFVLLTLILTVIVHIGFALAVYSNARYNRDTLSHSSVFVGPVIWGIATLLGGVFVAATYWLIHHSKLRAEQMPLNITSKTSDLQDTKPSATENY